MRPLDLTDLHPAVRLAGVLDAAPAWSGGLALSRLRRAAIDQLTDPVLLFTATMPSGGRIELRSDTTAIELDLHLTFVAYGDEPPASTAIDLVVDDEVVDGHRTAQGNVFRIRDRRRPDVEVETGPPVTIRFDGLAPIEKSVEVWLPHSCSVELLGIRLDEGASLAPAPRPARRWVHYGSSISHCIEAPRPTGVWPVIAARAAGVDLQSLAIAGQAHLDPFAARTIRDLDAELISLKVGINLVNGDTMRERTFAPAVHGFLDTIRDGHPATPLLVISPIVCPVVEDQPGPTMLDADGRCAAVPRPRELGEGALSLGRIRAILDTVVERRRSAGDTALHLLDGRELFGPADLHDLPDGLHPNGAGYARMAERFLASAFGPGGPFEAT